LCLTESEVLRNRHLRVAANRYSQLLRNVKKHKIILKARKIMKLIKFIVVLIFTFSTSVVFCQTRYEVEKFDKILTDLQKNGEFNGNILIAHKGNIIFEKSYGFAELSTQRLLDTKSIFELASVSKQFTAMAIYLLSKQGKLNLNDNISKFIPELSFYDNLTISNLVHHTSGLPDYMRLFDEKWDKSKFATNYDIVKMFAEHKSELNFKPNERFQYSNTGYALLGYIIEKVSKMEFEKFLDINIFKPLKMKNTFVYRSRFRPKKVENYALGYVTDSLENNVLTNSFGKEYYTYYLDGIVGDGMVNSNLYDLLKWDQALYSNKFINKNDKDIIFNSSQTLDGNLTNYGFGWFVNNNKELGLIANHSGGWAGYRTHIERHIDKEKTIIILQNISNANTISPIKYATNLLYNKELEFPLRLSNEVLKQYTGTYLINNKTVSSIIFESNKLWTVMEDGFKLPLKPISETKFSVIGFSPEVTYEFFLNEQREVTKFRCQQKEQNIDYEGIKNK